VQKRTAPVPGPDRVSHHNQSQQTDDAEQPSTKQNEQQQYEIPQAKRTNYGLWKSNLRETDLRRSQSPSHLQKGYWSSVSGRIRPFAAGWLHGHRRIKPLLLHQNRHTSRRRMFHHRGNRPQGLPQESSRHEIRPHRRDQGTLL